MKRFYFLSFFILTLLLHQAASAGFEGSVSQTTIPEGESFQLYLRQDGDAEQPDISVLNEDFIITGQRKSFKSTYINGKSEKFNETVLTLIPRKTGTVVLPSISAGKEKTAPVTLTVVPGGTPVPSATAQGSAPSSKAQAKVFVRAAVGKTQPFVQEQTVYTVRLFTSTPILDGMITPPHADGVAIEQWGDPKRSQTVVNDQPYTVTEYRFVLFPQKSGKITLPPTRFQGLITDPDAQEQSMEDMFGGFGFGGRTAFSGFFGHKNIAVQSQEITLDVRPKPASAVGAWLPATDVAVSEDITPPKTTVTMGDALTRTVTVMVSGVRDTQIPDPSFPDGAGYKQYPGKTDTKNLFDDKGIVGVKTRQIVFMPTQPGELVLPSMEVPWFDVKTRKMKTAVLPSRTVTVTPGEGGAVSPALAPSTSVPAEEKNDAVTPQTPPSAPSGASAVAPAAGNEGGSVTIVGADPVRLFGAGLLSGAGAILLLWAVYRLLRNGKDTATRRKGHEAADMPRAKAVRLFKAACLGGNPAEAKKALLKVGAVYWPENPPLSLSELADRFADDAFFVQVENLNQALYAREASEWSGEALWQAFRATRQYAGSSRPEDDAPVPPLYPR
jgi:hypothetical protein